MTAETTPIPDYARYELWRGDTLMRVELVHISMYPGWPRDMPDPRDPLYPSGYPDGYEWRVLYPDGAELRGPADGSKPVILQRAEELEGQQ